MPSRIIETKNFKGVHDRLIACGPESLILVDVDNTIITPKAAMFRTGSPYRKLVDDIKAGKYPDIDSKQIVSRWRKDRKVLLVDADWPRLLKQIREQSVPIFAFTQMNTGPYGIIESIERWRHDELKSMEVMFTERFAGHAQITLLPKLSEINRPLSKLASVAKCKEHTELRRGVYSDVHEHSSTVAAASRRRGGTQQLGTEVELRKRSNDAAVFYKGIFFTGNYSKRTVLPKILELYAPKEVVFVDDLHENVADLQEVCSELNIPYTGIIFRGVDRIVAPLNKKIALAQKDSLLKFGKWLEDEAITF